MRDRVEIWIKEIGAGDSCFIVVHSSISNLSLDSMAELVTSGGGDWLVPSDIRLLRIINVLH